jgi:hypothetical protein
MYASKLGHPSGNHFLTVTEGKENLRPLDEVTLWEDAQDILFERFLRAPSSRLRGRDVPAGEEYFPTYAALRS